MEKTERQPDYPGREDSRFFFQGETYRVGDVSFDIHAKNVRTSSYRQLAGSYPHRVRARIGNVGGGQN